MSPVQRGALAAACALVVLFCAAAPVAAQQCPPNHGVIKNIHGTGYDGKTYTFAWDPLPGDLVANVYEILLRTGNGYCSLGSSTVVGTTTKNSYTIQLGTANLVYGVYVRLQSDPCTTSEYILLLDTFTTVPSKPSPPAATANGSSVTVTFSYSDDHAFAVDLERAGSDGRWVYLGAIQTCSSNPKTYVDSNLPDGTYKYRVGVYNAANYATSDVYSDPVTVTVGATVQPVINAFAVTPPTIRAGKSAVLSFTTTNATSVTIDQGLGAQPASGSVVVTPAATTTYTLTAMNGGQTVTATAAVTVVTAPAVAVSDYPSAMVQPAGGAGGTTSYTLTNAGGSPTNISLSQTGIFFNQSPASFTLPPGGSQTVTITALAQPAGGYEGTSVIAGAGVPANLQIPIKLLSAPASSGTVNARAVVNRVDVSASAGTSPSGTVSFTNSGTATLNGILVSDVPWLVPQSGIVSIPAGGTGTFTFSCDRSKRSDADAPLGSVRGRLGIVFLGGSTAGSGQLRALGGTTPTVSIVSVVDTVKPAVGTNAAPPLSPGEVALFVPGVGHVAGSVGTFISDLSIVNPPGNKPVPDLKFFYLPLNGSPVDQKSATLPTVSIASLAVADVVKNVFGVDGQVGSLQLRAADVAKLGVNATIFNISNLAGTYGSSIPIFRSDRSVAQGSKLVLSGIVKTPTSHTNLFIQETSGLGATVNTEFVAVDGSSLGTRSDSVGPFVLTQLNNVVPSGAVSAILTNASSNGAKFQAYATPVDEASGDTWSVADWTSQYGYSGNAPTVIPVAGVVHGANNTFFRTDVALTNSGSAQASGTLRYVSRSGTAVDRQVTLGPRQSSILSDVIGSLFNVTTDDVGYLLFTPLSGTFAMTSRTYTTVAGQPATFGTGVPALALANALKPGALRAIGAIEDSSKTTIVEARPGTFRTNYGLVETSGNPATVRVTVRFQYPTGSLVTAVGTASKDYSLAANQFLQVNGLMTDILGQATRDTLGDLRGIEVDFQVISTTGAVAVFTSSIDNGSGDSTLRTE